MAGYAKGDPHISQLILEKFGPRLLRLSTQILRNQADAEDIVQETMLRLWKKAPYWEESGASVSTWLWRVSVNLSIDKIRKRKKSEPISENVVDQNTCISELLENRDRVVALQVALQTLPKRQRIAVILRHIEGESNQHISSILGISISAVESIVARGMRSLKKQLVPRREELGWEK